MLTSLIYTFAQWAINSHSLFFLRLAAAAALLSVLITRLTSSHVSNVLVWSRPDGETLTRRSQLITAVVRPLSAIAV